MSFLRKVTLQFSLQCRLLISRISPGTCCSMELALSVARQPAKAIGLANNCRRSTVVKAPWTGNSRSGPPTVLWPTPSRSLSSSPQGQALLAVSPLLHLVDCWLTWNIICTKDSQVFHYEASDYGTTLKPTWAIVSMHQLNNISYVLVWAIGNHLLPMYVRLRAFAARFISRHVSASKCV